MFRAAEWRKETFSECIVFPCDLIGRCQLRLGGPSYSSDKKLNKTLGQKYEFRMPSYIAIVIFSSAEQQLVLNYKRQSSMMWIYTNKKESSRLGQLLKAPKSNQQ